MANPFRDWTDQRPTLSADNRLAEFSKRCTTVLFEVESSRLNAPTAVVDPVNVNPDNVDLVSAVPECVDPELTEQELTEHRTDPDPDSGRVPVRVDRVPADLPALCHAVRAEEQAADHAEAADV